MKTKKRTINYPDLDLPCEICGKRFKTRQGLAGHKQFKHASASEGPLPIVDKASPGGSARPSVKELESEVKTLKLQQEKRELEARLPTAARPMDLMEAAGLGAIEGNAKSMAQMRALGVVDQEKPPGWLEKILGNPEGLRIVIEGLKSVLGTNNNNQGDNVATVLSSLGFNLKDLLQNSLAPKGGAALEVGGLNLSGITLNSQVLTSLLEYKAKTEAAQIEAAGRREMSDALKGVFKTVGEGIASGALGKPGAGRDIGREISRQQPQPQKFVAECPVCHFSNVIEGDIEIGSTIKCQGKDKFGNPCEESWVVSDPNEEQRQQRKAKKVQVEEMPKSIPCENCGQALNIEGKPLGSELLCPICQGTQVLMSPDIALEPELPNQEPGKFLRG